MNKHHNSPFPLLDHPARILWWYHIDSKMKEKTKGNQNKRNRKAVYGIKEKHAAGKKGRNIIAVRKRKEK